MNRWVVARLIVGPVLSSRRVFLFRHVAKSGGVKLESLGRCAIDSRTSAQFAKSISLPPCRERRGVFFMVSEQNFEKTEANAFFPFILRFRSHTQFGHRPRECYKFYNTIPLL